MEKWICIGLMLVLFCSKTDGVKTDVPKEGGINIDGTWISKNDIDTMVFIYRQQALRVMPDEALLLKTEELKKEVSMQLIANELLLREAKKRRFSIDAAKFDNAYKGFIKQFPDTVAMKKEFAKIGQTEKNVQNKIRDGLMVDSLMKIVRKNADTVTFSECKAFYDSNTAQFSPGKKMRASQILLTVKKGIAPEIKKKIAEKARKIAEELRAGKDFSAYVKKYSEDPGAASGGDIGWFKKGDIKPEFERAAMGLKIDSISDVFETDLGFHIIKKTGEEDLPSQPFKEVSDQIQKVLSLKRQNDTIKKFVDSLLTRATITYTDTSYKPLKK